jgi:hypothetical protein
MLTRRLHRIAGLLLVLPILAWAATGALFHLKPGWGPAYQQPTLQVLPLRQPTPLPELSETCLETRRLRTVLGEHLLLRSVDGWTQVDPTTLLERPHPTAEEFELLLKESLKDEGRYARITTYDELSATTEEGVTVSLNWNSMRLSQTGSDTRLINKLYEIHYLRWTGIELVDRVLAVAGLSLLVVLCLLGIKVAVLPSLEPRRTDDEVG